MKIRSKLLALLLLVSLVPVLAVVLLTRFSIRRLSAQITNDIQTKEFQDITEGVAVHVHNYREAVIGSNNALQLALRLQTKEVQKRLAGVISNPFPQTAESAYGFNAELSIPAERWLKEHPFSDSISFQHQVLHLVADIDPKAVQQDVERLSTMTEVYHELYEANRGRTLWHYTSLENGLHTAYPGRKTAPVPKEYDPRKRTWYTQAKDSQGSQIAASIIVDVSTKDPVLTLSMPVYYPDGKFAGVTAIDKKMNEYFSGLKIPAALQKKAKLYLVGLGLPGEAVEDNLVVFWSNQTQLDQLYSDTDWQDTIVLQPLKSSDQGMLAHIIEDVKGDKAGVRTMKYNGKKAIWAYSRRIGQKAALIMIVPFDVVRQLAEQTQSTLLDENLKQMRLAGLFILAIVAIAAVLALISAGKFTRPINQLAAAANILAEGDFTAKADIQTGDELQRLAEVFNDLGPKLQEHEKTQRSLALARAIQQNLLPQRAPEIDGFQIAGRCRYCDETGGDYFDFIHLPDSENQKVGIVLGDVTGHGVGAALLMASARSILRNASLHFTGDLAELMTQFNDQLSEDTGDDKFMTLFYGALDNTNRTLTWASGGHDPALWYHEELNTFEELPNTGPLTGYMKDMPYEQAGPVTLKVGDVLLVGTDGIWEAENTDGRPYGKERLHELIQTHKDHSSQQIVDMIIKSVEDFCAPVAPTDDVTLIVIKAI
ncbi:MAG: SpoIIE family protein phosphatase [Planctomycetota bacterium]|jgi:sigma-B regulation protein RsbU (phosphoserine phosphatase)